MNWLIRWLRTLFHRHRGFWVCPDDWQGETLGDCQYYDERPPVKGVSVYYDSGFGLKPWGKR